MGHPKNRAERRAHNQRIIRKRIGAATDWTYSLHAPWRELYHYHVNQFAKKHPFTCGRKGCGCKERDKLIDRRLTIEDFSDEDY